MILKYNYIPFLPPFPCIFVFFPQFVGIYFFNFVYVCLPYVLCMYIPKHTDNYNLFSSYKVTNLCVYDFKADHLVLDNQFVFFPRKTILLL